MVRVLPSGLAGSPCIDPASDQGITARSSTVANNISQTGHTPGCTRIFSSRGSLG